MKRFNLFAVMSLLMLLWVAAACATGTPDNHLSHTSDTHSTSFENITQKGLADSNQLPSKPSPTSPIKLSGETTHHEKGLLPERERTSHPSYFLHPKQQAEYALVFELAAEKYIPASVYDINRPKPVPWYMCDTRPNNGFIDNCKPANLTFKGSLNFAS
ncbi:MULTISPECIES: hypothetical protein [Pseudoalteromonas]|uniref:hypothetical protein n=1 Tax=Pseudoalteromonas TaxID=53246 RepID=UPI00029A806A|nr:MULTISPECIES: hypothetical protein [Pseudoalteromonas]AUJ72051.1 hypothetical protein PNC201_19170 [Pseudoalteromonas sp. NC201]MCG7553596.1 hypothetical protein [Pseudoalteromonas sp. Of11M-6]QUI68331.1 hypothetical protein GSF13_00405 [Pseudoalteromonas sp. M8]UDM64027.1 hypothetical protein KIJ96_18710 [Pseudoalteromonas piscicida]